MTSLERTIRAIAADPAFEAASAPFAVTDRRLRIQAVNTAYEKATLRRRDELIGYYLFDAFPENEPTHEANGLANITASLESVFQRRRRHRMSVQRYDVPARDADGFVQKSWSPVNSPIHGGDGDVVAALIHVEDVTGLHMNEDEAAPTDDAGRARTLAVALARLGETCQELNTQNEHLRRALASNRDIGAAIGILMFSRRATYDAAFEMLRGASQQGHRKLWDVAQEVIDTGGLPLPAQGAGEGR